MMHPDEPIVPIQVRDISATAARIGIELEIIPLGHAHELERAFERAVHWRAQGLLRLAGQATVIGPPTAELARQIRAVYASVEAERRKEIRHKEFDDFIK